MRTFVTYDGTDANGVRAEVYVQAGGGLVKEIKVSPNGTADVHLTVENLKFPIHGWIATNNPLFAEIEKAKEEGKEIEFRVEAQRKKHVDRKTPIGDLRTDATKARENTIQILASVNGKSSDEAVTLPSEDPAAAPYGRIKATEVDAVRGNNSGVKVSAPVADVASILETLKQTSKSSGVSDDIINVIAAQAILAGATPEDVQIALGGVDRRDNHKPILQQGAFAVEGPMWKDYNSDGRVNLGSLQVAAGIGAESFIREQLVSKVHESELSNPAFDVAVSYFAGLVLSISDKVQSQAYGGGFRVDRGANSHTRARGIVYDTISKYFPLPISTSLIVDADPATVKAWVSNVGRMSVTRFKAAADVAVNVSQIDEFYEIPAGLLSPASQAAKLSEAATAEATVAPVEPVEAVEAVSEATAVEVPAVEVPAVEVEPAVAQVEPAIVEDVEPVNDKSKKAPATVNPFEGLDVYPQSPVDASLIAGGKIPADIAATEETIAMFKEFIEDSGVPKDSLKKVTGLLTWTFGPKFNKAQLIPDESLIEFIDFYVASGADNFLDVLDKVNG